MVGEIEGTINFVGDGTEVEVDKFTPLACNVSAMAVGKNSLDSGVTTAFPIEPVQPLSIFIASSMKRKL
jgi:hypothetical protein